jgi:parallel beta-helix repeat protein
MGKGNICRKCTLRKLIGITSLAILLLAGSAGAATPISACTTISSPGSYVLNQSIVNTLSSCIIITTNNVTFDGAGFTITGGGSGYGVSVYGPSNVTVKNLKITNWNYGIYYRDVKNNGNIVNNTINNSAVGIYLQNSQANNISGNMIGNCSSTGIHFSDINSWYNTIKNNMVNGDIYYHLVNENDIVIEGLNLNAPKVSNLGKVSVISSKNVTLRNLILTNNSGADGLFLYDSNASMNNINSSFNDNGIRLYYSSNNTINGSNTSSNIYRGMFLEHSNNNSLDSNIEVSNLYLGIYLFHANNNKLTNNIARSNSNNGITLSSSNNNTLSSNTISNSYGSGIEISPSSYDGIPSNNNILTNNTVNSTTHGNGISLSSSSNNTLSSNTISNSYSSGIELSSSSFIGTPSNNNNLTNNTVNSNQNGFSLSSSSNNILTNNTANNNAVGISLSNSQANNISCNVMGNSSTTGIGFIDIKSVYNTIKNNMVNGDVYYHLVNENDTVVDGLNLNAPKVSSLGKISVISSKNVTLRNLILTNNSGASGSGLFLYDSNASMSNINSSSNYYGIRLYYSSNNTINRSNTSSNTQYGVSLEYSNNNSLDNNIAVSNQLGIYLSYSNNNNLTNNNARSNGYGTYGGYLYGSGIVLSSSSNNTLNGNNVSNNIFVSPGINIVSFSNNNTLSRNIAVSNTHGIYLSSSGGNTLNGNNASNNAYNGITLSSSSNNNTLSSNIILNNNNYGISVASSGMNSIYNNFFNNTRNFGIDSSVNRWNITKTSGTNIAGGPNLGGNFWANPGGTGFSQTCTDVDKDGICDSSYTINSENIDYLPLTMRTLHFPPVAECGPDKLKCENVGSPAQFNASVSYDPDGAIISYDWDFGDGTNATGVTPVHKYSTYRWNGTAYQAFTVNLTVTDNDGMTNSTSMKVVIWIPGDANGDGKVNILDASVIGLKWGTFDLCADLNNDGKVNILDASIIGLNWGKRG